MVSTGHVLGEFQSSDWPGAFRVVALPRRVQLVAHGTRQTPALPFQVSHLLMSYFVRTHELCSKLNHTTGLFLAHARFITILDEFPLHLECLFLSLHGGGT